MTDRETLFAYRLNEAKETLADARKMLEDDYGRSGSLEHFPEICVLPGELFKRNRGLSRHFADRIGNLTHHTLAHQAEELKHVLDGAFGHPLFPGPLHHFHFGDGSVHHSPSGRRRI